MKFKFGESFTFMFKDPNWITKFLIGILIAFVPILNFAWSGYGIGLMRNMARGDEYPLPEWDEIGSKVKDGLFIAIAGFVYNLPMFLLMCLGYIPLIIAGNDTSSSTADMMMIVWGLVGCCMTIYLLLFSFLLPAILVHYARENTFGSLFQVGTIFKLVSGNIGQYLMAWLASLVAVLIFSIVAPFLTLLCVFPIYFGAGWLMSVIYYAYGQVGMIARSNEASVIQ